MLQRSRTWLSFAQTSCTQNAFSWKMRQKCVLTDVVQLWPDYSCASLWIFRTGSEIMTLLGFKFRVAADRRWHSFLTTAEVLLKNTRTTQETKTHPVTTQNSLCTPYSKSTANTGNVWPIHLCEQTQLTCSSSGIT